MSKSFFAVDKLNVVGKECFSFICFAFNNKDYLVYYTPSSNKKCEIYLSEISSDNTLIDISSSDIKKFTPIVRDMVVLPSSYKKEDDISDLINEFVGKYDVKFLDEVPDLGEQDFHNISSLFEIELDYIEYVDYFYSSALPRVKCDDNKEDSEVKKEIKEEKPLEKEPIYSEESDDDKEEVIVKDTSTKEEVGVPDLKFSFTVSEDDTKKEEPISNEIVSSNESSSSVGAPTIADSLANYNAANNTNLENSVSEPTTNANVLDQIDASSYFGNIPTDNGNFAASYGAMNSPISSVSMENNSPFFVTNNDNNVVNNGGVNYQNNDMSNSYQNYGFNMPYMMNNGATTNAPSYGVSNVAVNSSNPNFQPGQPNLVTNKNAGFASSKYIIIGTLCLIAASVIVAISIIFVNNL